METILRKTTKTKDGSQWTKENLCMCMVLLLTLLAPPFLIIPDKQTMHCGKIKYLVMLK